MANFFAEYGSGISGALSGLGGWGVALGAGVDAITSKKQAEAAQKAADKAATMQYALPAPTYPGAPVVVQGGTGLAPAIPTWVLVAAGAALLLIVATRRR